MQSNRAPYYLEMYKNNNYAHVHFMLLGWHLYLVRFKFKGITHGIAIENVRGTVFDRYI